MSILIHNSRFDPDYSLAFDNNFKITYRDICADRLDIVERTRPAIKKKLDTGLSIKGDYLMLVRIFADQCNDLETFYLKTIWHVKGVLDGDLYS
jgi:hypothetical protein